MNLPRDRQGVAETSIAVASEAGPFAAPTDYSLGRSSNSVTTAAVAAFAWPGHFQDLKTDEKRIKWLNIPSGLTDPKPPSWPTCEVGSEPN